MERVWLSLAVQFLDYLTIHDGAVVIEHQRPREAGGLSEEIGRAANLPEALLFDLPPLALDAAFRRAEREDRAEGKPSAQPQGLDRPTAG